MQRQVALYRYHFGLGAQMERAQGREGESLHTRKGGKENALH